MSKKGYLTNTEYKAIRQLLGFSQAEAQEFHGVQNIRTIKRWENGNSQVSELACDKITELLKKINWTISAGLQQYDDLSEDEKKETEIVLIIYPDTCYKKFAAGFKDLPNSIHKTMTFRLYAALKEQGAEVGIVEFNPQDYFTFLAANNYTDAQDIRAIWAIDYRKKILPEE